MSYEEKRARVDAFRRGQRETGIEEGSTAERLISFERFADNAKTEFFERKKQLEADGGLTPEGVRRELRPMLDAFEAKAQTYGETIESIVATEAAKADKLDIPPAENQTADIALAESYARATPERKREMNRNLILGRSPELAAALVRTPPEISGITSELRAQAKSTLLTPAQKTRASGSVDNRVRAAGAKQTLRSTLALMRREAL